MSVGVSVALMILLVATRPFEVRAWRAGRISDRTAAILILGRFPLIGLLVGVFSGAGIPATALLVGLMAIPAVLLYGWSLRRIQDAHAELLPTRPGGD
jgi:hypothetical protein